MSLILARSPRRVNPGVPDPWYGHRWKLFCLGLRFIGWILLCLLTFGIGLLWLWPYMGVSYARFYDDVAD